MATTAPSPDTILLTNRGNFMLRFSTPSRREFITMLGGAATLAGIDVASALGSGAAATPSGLDRLVSSSGVDWRAVRRRFHLRKGLVYLNNGTLGPCPDYVMQQAFDAWRTLEENPADEGFGPLLQRIEEVRHKAAGYLGCSQDEMVITHSTTDGMNIVAQGIVQGLDLKAGDRVLTTNHEHPGGSVCWDYYAKRRGIAIDRIQLPVPPQSAEAILSEIDRKLTRSTRVISVSHVIFSTGLRLPIREIGERAEANGALLVVDGAQGPGAMSVDVKQLGCHTYATSAHKWLLAPKGTGLLYISATARQRIDPLVLQSGYGIYTAATGTRNIVDIIGLGAAIDFLGAIGKERVEQRALGLRRRVCEGLMEVPAVSIASPLSGDLASAIVTFVLPDRIQNGAFAESLRERHNIIVKVVPGELLNGIRISTHVYNSEEDVARLIAAVKRELSGS